MPQRRIPDFVTDQFFRPISDLSAGSWTTAPLWSKVDDANPEGTSADGDSITSETLSAPGNTSSADLRLTTANADPLSSVGHVMRMRALDTLTLGSAGTLTAELRQGDSGSSILIASLVATLTTSFALFQYALSAGEADSITDYTNLFIRLYGTFGVGNLGGVTVSDFELETPPAAPIPALPPYSLPPIQVFNVYRM